jgi:hypothetical protein
VWALAWCFAAKAAEGTAKHPPAINAIAAAAAANWRAGDNRTPVRFPLELKNTPKIGPQKRQNFTPQTDVGCDETAG